MLSFQIANRLIAVIVLLWLAPVSASADSLHFLVLDAEANPLEDAVILVPGHATRAPDTLAIMDQVDKNFVPNVLVIQQGQQVSFPNSDNIRHHVYSFSPAKAFEIKLYAGVPEAPVMFDSAGIVVLGCNIHDNMVGYIVVADTALATKTDAQGLAGVATAEVPATVRVWHPFLASTARRPLTIPTPGPNANGIRVISLNITSPAPAARGGTFGNRLKHSHGQ